MILYYDELIFKIFPIIITIVISLIVWLNGENSFFYKTLKCYCEIMLKFRTGTMKPKIGTVA